MQETIPPLLGQKKSFKIYVGIMARGVYSRKQKILYFFINEKP